MSAGPSSPGLTRPPPSARRRAGGDRPTGRASSIAAARRSSVTSSPGLPPSCTESGRPAPSNPAGTDAAGWPIAFQMPYHGTREAAAFSVHGAPRPWSSPTRNGGPAGPGSSTTSARLVDLVDARGDRRLGRPGLGELCVGDQAAHARHAPRAALEALRMRQLGRVVPDPAQVAREQVEERRRRIVDLPLDDLMAERAQQVGRLVQRALLGGAELRDRARRGLHGQRDAQRRERLVAGRSRSHPRGRRRRSRRGTAPRPRRAARAGRRPTGRARRRGGRGRARCGRAGA